MSVYNLIRAALETQLTENVNWFLRTGEWRTFGEWFDAQDWETGETIMSPALPGIARQNARFARAEGVSFIEITFDPVLRRAVTAGPDPEKRTSGLFYATVYTPEAVGSGAGFDIADQIVSRFDASSAILYPDVIVRIEYGEAKPALHTPPFFAIPVEIGWYAYKR
jgi:hypothetical protein